MPVPLLLNIKSAADLAGIESFIGMVGSAISAVKDFAAENDRFVQLMNAGSMELAGVIDSSSASLIDTGLALQKTFELTNAGLDLTKEQYAAVATATTQLGRVTGDVDGEFSKLTKALAKGSIREFERYGITVKKTEDKQADMARALDQLVQKYSGVEIKTENVTEGFSALSNNVGTLTGQLWGELSKDSGLVDGLNSINGELSSMSSNLAESTSQTQDLLKYFPELAAEIEKIEATQFGATGLYADNVEKDLNKLAQLQDRAAKLIENRVRLQEEIEASIERRQYFGPSGDFILDTGTVYDEEAIKTQKFTTSVAKVDKGKSPRETRLEREKRIVDDLIGSYGEFNKARAEEAAFFSAFGSQNDPFGEFQMGALERQIRSVGQDENLTMQAQLLREEIASRQNLISQLGYDPDSLEYKQQVLAITEAQTRINGIHHDQEIEKQRLRTQELGSFYLALENWNSEINIGADMTSMAIQSLNQSFVILFDTLTGGRAGSIWKALGKMVRQMAVAGAAEMTILSITEGVKALVAAAGQNYVKAADHGKNALAAGIAATTLGGIAMAARSESSTSSKAGSSAGNAFDNIYNQQPAQFIESTQSQEVNITVDYKHGSGGIVQAVIEEAETRDRNGQKTLVVTSGR